MATSKASLETAIRNDILAALIAFLSENYDTDVMDVSASEITMPVVDAEGNEKFALIKVSIPRGTRVAGGYEPYDGYAAHEEWELDKAEKADKAAARKEKAERAEKEKERKRAAKQTIKKLNTVGFKALITEPITEGEQPFVNFMLIFGPARSLQKINLTLFSI